MFSLNQVSKCSVLIELYLNFALFYYKLITIGTLLLGHALYCYEHPLKELTFRFLMMQQTKNTSGLNKYLYFGVRTCIYFRELRHTRVSNCVFEWVSSCNFLLTYFPSIGKCHFHNICQGCTYDINQTYLKRFLKNIFPQCFSWIYFWKDISWKLHMYFLKDFFTILHGSWKYVYEGLYVIYKIILR